MSDETDKQPDKQTPPAPAAGESTALSKLLGVLGFAVTLAAGFYGGRWISDTYDIKPVRWFNETFRGQAPELQEGERVRVELRGDEPSRGPADALVTIIEFSDFQCPYCAKAVPPLDEAMADDKDVRLIFKHYPLPMHSGAVPAARATWAAHQQGKFWEVHDWLFAHKGTVTGIADFARGIGIDVEKFDNDRASEASSKSVDSDHLAGGKAGAGGTPYFVVNGHGYSGVRSVGEWKSIIAHEKRAAEALVDQGTPRSEAYAALMKDAKDVLGDGAAVGGAPSKRKAAAGGPDPTIHYKIPLDDRPAKGPADALVTIVAFSDFQCPYCARVNPTIEALMERYGDLRVVFRQRPLSFHPMARPAAAAALAAYQQGKFWEMHDLLFAAQKALSPSTIRGHAETLGLDLIAFDAAVADPATEAWIAEDERLAGRMGANGTPAFFLNGRFLNGAQPLEAFAEVIDEELAAAKAMVDAGTPRAEVYEKIMATAADKVGK
ncbi:MAG: thioredoxin domain-containing protein [Nannocystaceae bacterium]